MKAIARSKKWKLLLVGLVAVAIAVPLAGYAVVSAVNGEWTVQIECPGDQDCPQCPVDAITVNVPGSGAGNITNGGKFTPTSMPFNWTVTGYGYKSQTYTQNDNAEKILKVDGTHLCCMHIEIAAAGARVRIKGAGDQWTNSDCICLPKSVTITWSLILGKNESQTYTKHVDCTPLNAGLATQPSYCTFKVVIPDELAAAGGTVRIVNVGPGLTNGTEVTLPVSNTIQWDLTVNKHTTELYTKHVDCSDLVVPPCTYCPMQILMPPELSEQGATVRIDGAGLPGQEHGDIVILPKCIFIKWALTVYGKESQLYGKHVDCSPLNAACTPTFCEMEIDMPDELATAGAVVRIKDTGLDFKDGDTVALAISLDLQWKLRIPIGSYWFEGDWKTKHVDCTPLMVTTADYCKYRVMIPKGSLLRLRQTGMDFVRGNTFVLPREVTFKYSVDGAADVTHAPPCKPTDLK